MWLELTFKQFIRFSWRSEAAEIAPQPSASEGIRNFSGASLWKIFELLSGSESHFSSLKYAEQIHIDTPYV